MYHGIWWNAMALTQVDFNALSYCFLALTPLVIDTIVAPFSSDYLSSYLSLLPSPNDAVLSFGPMDTLFTPAQHYIPTRLYNLFPHPAQDSGEKRKYIAALSSR